MTTSPLLLKRQSCIDNYVITLEVLTKFGNFSYFLSLIFYLHGSRGRIEQVNPLGFLNESQMKSLIGRASDH